MYLSLRATFPCLLLVLACGVSTAQAHFVWLIPAGQNVRLCFSEEPAPGRAGLIEKVAHARQQWLPRSSDPQTLSASKAADGDVGYLTAAAPAGQGDVIAVCRYGVYK